MPHMTVRTRWWALVFVSLTSSCTAYVLQNAEGEAYPCDNATDCPSGTACQTGQCQQVSTPDPQSDTLSVDGGTLVQNSVVLVVPSDALAEAANINIKAVTATYEPVGIAAHGRVYEVLPALTLDVAARIELPSAGCADCVVYWYSGETLLADGTWTALGATTAQAPAHIAGTTARLGYFVVAEAQ